jgi:predicted nucleic acid-binding protein
VSLPELLGLDTNCFVYYIEDPPDSPRRRFLQWEVFEPMAAGRMHAATSAITVAELLVAAHRQGAGDRALGLRAALEAIPNLRVVDVDIEVAARAAEIRGRWGAALPDAIQVATCLSVGAGALLTNDTDMRRLGEAVDVIILDDVAANSGTRPPP